MSRSITVESSGDAHVPAHGQASPPLSVQRENVDHTGDRFRPVEDADRTAYYLDAVDILGGKLT